MKERMVKVIINPIARYHTTNNYDANNERS